MNKFGPERLRTPRLYVALRSLSAAGLLALTACSPAQPVEAGVSPVVDVPSAVHPCDIPEPTCQPSPTPSETEPPGPIVIPSPTHRPTRTAKPRPRGYACNWLDMDGKRQPLVSDDDVIVKVDGRCRKPDPLAPINIHSTPDLRGPVVDTVENGDELTATCSMKSDTHFMDARGRRSASNIVLRVITPNDCEGYISEVTVGYIDETQERLNGALPTCT